MIPTSSLDSVAGLETFWPSCPPVSTCRPAAFAGSAASMIFCASPSESCAGADGQRHRQIARRLVLAERRGALRREWVDDRGDVGRLRDVRGRLVDGARVLGVGQLPARARAARSGSCRCLVGERPRERIRRALAVGSRQRQVVVGVFAEPVRDRDQRDRHEQPDGQHQTSLRHAKARHAVEDARHRSASIARATYQRAPPAGAHARAAPARRLRALALAPVGSAAMAPTITLHDSPALAPVHDGDGGAEPEGPRLRARRVRARSARRADARDLRRGQPHRPRHAGRRRAGARLARDPRTPGGTRAGAGALPQRGGSRGGALGR